MSIQRNMICDYGNMLILTISLDTVYANWVLLTILMLSGSVCKPSPCYKQPLVVPGPQGRAPLYGAEGGGVGQTPHTGEPFTTCLPHLQVTFTQSTCCQHMTCRVPLHHKHRILKETSFCPSSCHHGLFRMFSEHQN